MAKESKNQFGNVEVIDLDKKSEESFITQAPEEIENLELDNSTEKPLEEDDSEDETLNPGKIL